MCYVIGVCDERADGLPLLCHYASQIERLMHGLGMQQAWDSTTKAQACVLTAAAALHHCKCYTDAVMPC